MKTSSDNLSEISIIAMVKRMTLIFFSLMAGILMFLLVSVYLVEVTKTAGSSEATSVLLTVIPLIAISCTATAYVVSIGMLKKARAASKENQIGLYQSAYLARYALLEGPSILSIIGYYLTGNRLFLVTLAVVLAIMAINKPSVNRFRQDMGELI